MKGMSLFLYFLKFSFALKVILNPHASMLIKTAKTKIITKTNAIPLIIMIDVVIILNFKLKFNLIAGKIGFEPIFYWRCFHTAINYKLCFTYSSCYSVYLFHHFPIYLNNYHSKNNSCFKIINLLAYFNGTSAYSTL